ncbi:MAG: magnesium and cobalt transport protein CorA [Acidimicrobiaceae bacterium]|nr:magnesium and cobalt transport protein CorA [Acidimicrobiaceae bacterium]MBO0746743.1 magnesium and cobalt transport protein CorA [Acidimicrobiaceae bacterium]
MIVDCAHYADGLRQREEQLDIGVAAEIFRQGEDGFVWIALLEPDSAELAEVQSLFGLHDLAVEDAQAYHLRPKVELYEDGQVLFAVIRTAQYVDDREDVEFGEVSIFLSSRFLITVRRGVASDLAHARRNVEARPELLKMGPAAGLWAILDKIVDDYAPVVAGLENDVEQIEANVFRGTAAATERIYKLRREATDFYRAVHPLLGPLDTLERTVYPQVGKQLRPFFRDVNDHLKFVNEEVLGLRDVLATVLQANIAVISLEQNDINVRQNETTKQLTIIATIFLPLSFLTGFFGQNFGWLVAHIAHLWEFLVFGLGSLAASCAVLFAWFRRGGLTGSG